MAKVKVESQGSMVTMRFPVPLLEKIDGFMRGFEKENPGIRLSRAAAIRMLVTKGLTRTAAVEKASEGE